jgi:hypothetical protein
LHITLRQGALLIIIEEEIVNTTVNGDIRIPFRLDKRFGLSTSLRVNKQVVPGVIYIFCHGRLGH